MTLSPHHLGIRVTAHDLKVTDVDGSQSRVLGPTERQGNSGSSVASNGGAVLGRIVKRLRFQESSCSPWKSDM